MPTGGGIGNVNRWLLEVLRRHVVVLSCAKMAACILRARRPPSVVVAHGRITSPLFHERLATMDILVSACLLGYSCRYDGGSKPCEAVCGLVDAGHVLIPLCPEVEGGLPVPHAPCELRKTPDGVRAISIDGVDCTAQYEAGARIAVEKAQSSGARVAILKSKSPSCGCGTVFDGTFSGTLCEGWGIAAAALRDVGVRVIDENHVANLEAWNVPRDVDVQ